MKSIEDIYFLLLKRYGSQGWWPFVNHKATNPTKHGKVDGYHPRDYSFPVNGFQRFEIITGAILTQNTTWTSVEEALLNLHKLCAFCPRLMSDMNEEKIRQAIKPVGYYNKKTQYLKNVAEFLLPIKNRVPTRAELLKVKGIGPETADCIMLYAFKELHFIVDSYTRRIFSHQGIIKGNESYKKIQELFELSLPKNLIVYQEYHALLNEHAKHYYRKKPYEDPILNSH